MPLKWSWKLGIAPAQEKIQKVKLDGTKADFIRSVEYESRFRETGWTLPRTGDNHVIPGLGAHIIDRVCYVNAKPERRFIATVYFRYDAVFRGMSTVEANYFLSGWNKEKLYRRNFKDIEIPLDDWVDPQIKHLEYDKLNRMTQTQKDNHQGIQLGYVNYLLSHFKNLNI